MSFDDRNPLRPQGRLTRDRVNGKFLGVCAGIGNYVDVDPTWVRLGFVLGTVLGFGSLIIVYFAVAVIAD